MEPLLLTEHADDKNAYAQMVSKTMAAVCNAIENGKAYTGPEPQELAQKIRSYDILPQHGLGFEKVMQNVEKDILPNFLRTSSTQYLAHLHGPSIQESICAELILSSFNQSMDSWDQSPVATETELATVQFLCSLFGYTKDANAQPDGCFTSGGSQSNLTGILLARDWFCNTALHHDIKKHGLPQNYAKFRLYTSEVSHFSMEKSCHLLGLGYDAVVKVPVNDSMQMDVSALAKLMEQDKANGYLPFCIVATIGTTDFGSIDDVTELRKLADKYGTWLHADAAYGSGLVMSQKYAERTGPLHVCNSITVDFHKMFLLPISCSAILIKNAEDFSPLELHADYLNREEDEEDGYTNLVGKSIQTTRRFDALKVWMTFQARGKDGYSQIISTCVENASYAYQTLCSYDDIRCAVKPEISSVVFRVYKKNLSDEECDTLNKKIRRTLLHTHGIVIGQTVYKNRTHLKFTLLNPRLTHSDIDSLIATIRSIAEEYVESRHAHA